MNTENTGNTPVDMTIGEYASKLNELERLQADVVRLQADSDRYKQQLEYQSSWRQNLKTKLDKAKLLVQTSIDNEEWTDSELEEPFWEELCEILEVELNKVFEVIITAEWSATLKGPRSMTLSDMADYVSISEPTVTSYVSVDIDDIYEREVDISEV